MATYTSHYNLKKPAIGETIDIADINGNMDILDDELYSVSQEVAKSGATYVSCSSITAVQNHLLTKYTDMEERESVLVAIKTTFTNSYFDVNSYWEGHMYCLDKTGTGYFTATLTNYSSANQVVISYANGTWNYNSIHNVKNLISAEATARTSAINTAVAAEQSARESADASINQAIANIPKKMYNIGQVVNQTIHNAIVAFANQHIGEAGLAVTYYISANYSPSDLPGTGTQEKYGYGQVIFRTIPSNGDFDATNTFYVLDSSKIYVRKEGLSASGTWQELVLKSNMTARANLWSGGLDDGSTVQFNESLANFQFALLSFHTNQEYATQIIPTENIPSGGVKISQTMMGANNSGQQTYPLPYNATQIVNLTLTSATAIQTTFNNVNYKVRLSNVHGLMRK